MDIISEGKRRFEVLFVDKSRDYLRAAAQFFQDEESSTPAELSRSVSDLHRQVLELVPQEEQGESSPEGREGAEALPLSFRLVAPLPLDLDFKQVMLALRSEKERLERFADYMKQLLPRLRLASYARSKAGGNGHCR
jgi:Lon protease-like protein